MASAVWIRASGVRPLILGVWGCGMFCEWPPCIRVIAYAEPMGYVWVRALGVAPSQRFMQSFCVSDDGHKVQMFREEKKFKKCLVVDMKSILCLLVVEAI